MSGIVRERNHSKGSLISLQVPAKRWARKSHHEHWNFGRCGKLILSLNDPVSDMVLAGNLKERSGVVPKWGHLLTMNDVYVSVQRYKVTDD